MTKSNIVFIGFMGTGKSSAGRMLARKLKKTLWDVDQWIETQEKKRISDIFKEQGEAHFRRLEKEAIGVISKYKDAVITTGGGAVLDPENLKMLSTDGWIVALHASPETIDQRVKGSKGRPLLQCEDRLGEIRRLLEQRQKYYARADISLNTDGKSTSEVVRLVMKALKKR